jgi:hypothetical protein
MHFNILADSIENHSRIKPLGCNKDSNVTKTRTKAHVCTHVSWARMRSVESML